MLLRKSEALRVLYDQGCDGNFDWKKSLVATANTCEMHLDCSAIDFRSVVY